MSKSSIRNIGPAPNVEGSQTYMRLSEMITKPTTLEGSFCYLNRLHWLRQDVEEFLDGLVPHWPA